MVRLLSAPFNAQAMDHTASYMKGMYLATAGSILAEELPGLRVEHERGEEEFQPLDASRALKLLR